MTDTTSTRQAMQHASAAAPPDVLGGRLQEAIRRLEATDTPARSHDNHRHNDDTALALASAHLASAEHVLVPAAGRAGLASECEDLLRAHKAANNALRALEMHLTGASQLARAARGRLATRVAGVLRDYEAREAAALARLAEKLDPSRLQRLVEDFEHTAQTAPTRPHLHGPRSGPLEGPAFAFRRRLDAVRDALDSRPVPEPRPQAPTRPLSRWSAYLLGLPEATPGRDDGATDGTTGGVTDGVTGGEQ